MRLRIDTSGIQFRVAAMPQKRPDFTDKSTNRASEKRQATTPDGRLIWTVRLDAIDNSNETRETIWVEVAGDEPKLTFDGFAQVSGLVYAPWVGRDGKIKRAFRADAITALADARKVNAA
jgi:hypothetical protein